MQIKSGKVFLGSFLPYAVIGLAACFAAKYANINDNCLWNGLAKGTVFAILFGVLTWIVLPKEDKGLISGFVKSIVKKIRVK